MRRRLNDGFCLLIGQLRGAGENEISRKDYKVEDPGGHARFPKQAAARKLAGLFRDNFGQYEDKVARDVDEAGPRA
jgi:hypothetical protein